MLKKLVLLFFDFILLALALLGFVRYSGVLEKDEFSFICFVFVPAIIYFIRNIVFVLKYPSDKMPDWLGVIFALFGKGVFAPSEILERKK